MKRSTSIFGVLLLCAVISAGSTAIAQKKRKHGKEETAAAPSANKPAADSAKKKEATPIKKYEEVITKDVHTCKGFITVHSKDDKFYFEIPRSLFGRDILTVNRIAKASVDMRNGPWGLAGDEIGEAVYSFERGPSNKLFLRRMSFSEYTSDSTRAMFAAVQKNNVQPIAAAFPILAFNPDSSAMVIDVTDFLNSDNEILYFQHQKIKERAGVSGQQNDRSYIKYVHTYTNNLEVRALKTYAAGLNPAGANYSLELNSSLVLLPEKPMQGRLRDERVGYFATGFRDFDANPQGVKEVVYARRWRLEPKPEDVEKYKRGELVEPAKPIVFYIDPATPKKWIPYLIQGVNDWQHAFERAGFKNAVYAREAPSEQEDSTWSLDDASHSAIIYRPSYIMNAMGPNVCDPRSGEIIESHIFWYHNVMKLLHDWYMVQCAAVDPRARKREFDDELMGQLIRFVSSHEVGHTLGLLHNFGASSTVPVENLRNKQWVEAHGHTPSIMDYARFNYVAQPEDHIGAAGLFPRINDYDNWAIEWGYRWRPEYKTPWEEQLALTKIVTDSLRNPRLWFGSEMEPADPRSQNEDLGDNAMKASAYGIKNLQRIMPQVAAWNAAPQESSEGVKDELGTIWSQYVMYVGHVMKNIGGVYHTPKVGAQPGPIEEIVSKAKQQEAMAFINREFFITPMWLNEKSLIERCQVNFTMELSDLQISAMNSLISRARLSHLLTAEIEQGKKAYGVQDFFADMDKSIYTELYQGKNVEVYRRNLQETYLNRVLEQAFAPDDQYNITIGSFHPTYSDLQGILREELRTQQALIKKSLLNPGLDNITRIHLREMNDKITRKFAIK
ncbi:zinc-dependent metalloprotease [Chitinophaga agrisoli]|uniref:Zinc-dependent metalloprotease n=1 Tax=Chitinophaga agrisoli TaxID=2607653 RepID=A0A5B2VLJ0_9BACT|nr:zinc-dependent metalloprotease [Chitinophaga agrisoli]KAA2239510.1 zinc-dependent metalloprotease [Chitinophaga agrisoli]